jgi:hypothetical protein
MNLQAPAGATAMSPTGADAAAPDKTIEIRARLCAGKAG